MSHGHAVVAASVWYSVEHVGCPSSNSANLKQSALFNPIRCTRHSVRRQADFTDPSWVQRSKYPSNAHDSDGDRVQS